MVVFPRKRGSRDDILGSFLTGKKKRKKTSGRLWNVSDSSRRGLLSGMTPDANAVPQLAGSERDDPQNEP